MIRTLGLSFRIGQFCLRDANIEIASGEYFVLLGPPGSGKSIFLELLCGLKRAGAGRIHIGGRDVTNLEPRQRGIGYVPQDYALFGHLSVERNIAFGLRAAGMSAARIRKKAYDVSEQIGIEHLLQRRIHGLSGGERQRVALARALVMQPKVLLLDEPVSTLDESTREKVCAGLRRLQQEFGVTAVHVSHQLEEAFSVADRAGILNNGTFQQIGTMDDLLRRPRSAFVANFTRCENLLTGNAVGPADQRDCTQVVVADQSFTVPGRHRGELKLVIRPENVRVATETSSAGDAATVLPVKLVRTVDRGAYVRVELEGPVRLVAHLSHVVCQDIGAVAGKDLTAIIRPEAIHVLCS